MGCKNCKNSEKKKSLLGNAGDFLSFIKDGDFRKVERDVAQDRFLKCSKCEYLKRPLYICDICDCLIRKKVRYKTQECPIGKWCKDE